MLLTPSMRVDREYGTLEAGAARTSNILANTLAKGFKLIESFLCESYSRKSAPMRSGMPGRRSGCSKRKACGRQARAG